MKLLTTLYCLCRDFWWTVAIISLKKAGLGHHHFTVVGETTQIVAITSAASHQHLLEHLIVSTAAIQQELGVAPIQQQGKEVTH